MPQEFDPQTGNIVTQEDARADPLPPLLHRSAIAVADGQVKPQPPSPLFAPNPGGRARCAVFVTSSGSPSACSLRPYLRSGGPAGQVGKLSLQSLNGPPDFDACFVVQVDGDDLYLAIESLAGGTAPTVSIFLSWR